MKTDVESNIHFGENLNSPARQNILISIILILIGLFMWPLGAAIETHSQRGELKCDISNVSNTPTCRFDVTRWGQFYSYIEFENVLGAEIQEDCRQGSSCRRYVAIKHTQGSTPLSDGTSPWHEAERISAVAEIEAFLNSDSPNVEIINEPNWGQVIWRIALGRILSFAFIIIGGAGLIRLWLRKDET